MAPFFTMLKHHSFAKLGHLSNTSNFTIFLLKSPPNIGSLGLKFENFLKISQISQILGRQRDLEAFSGRV
jgi:hypothetical protein